MITIEFDPRPAATSSAPISGAMEAFGRLLDRCDEENIRDVTLRLPAVLPPGLDAALRPVLNRPFRFVAWFRGIPPAPLADLFYSTGNRVIIGAVVSPHNPGELSRLLNSPAYISAPQKQVDLFLALPAPLANFGQGLDDSEPRVETNLTLGLTWNDLEAGPSAIPPEAEPEWARFLLAAAGWCTEHGVNVHLACGLPLCIFSTGQLGELALQNIRTPLATCAPSLVVTLDGRARVCPLLPAAGWAVIPAGVALREFENRLIHSSASFAAFCNRPNEQSCRSLATGACGGGCIAHNAREWHGGKNG